MTSLIWLFAMSFPLYEQRSPSMVLLPAQGRLMHFFAEGWAIPTPRKFLRSARLPPDELSELPADRRSIGHAQVFVAEAGSGRPCTARGCRGHARRGSGQAGQGCEPGARRRRLVRQSQGPARQGPLATRLRRRLRGGTPVRHAGAALSDDGQDGRAILLNIRRVGEDRGSHTQTYGGR